MGTKVLAKRVRPVFIPRNPQEDTSPFCPVSQCQSALLEPITGNPYLHCDWTCLCTEPRCLGDSLIGKRSELAALSCSAPLKSHFGLLIGQNRFLTWQRGTYSSYPARFIGYRLIGHSSQYSHCISSNSGHLCSPVWAQLLQECLKFIYVIY